MVCSICAYKIDKTFTLNLDFSVSSDGQIIFVPIEVYKCIKCNHLQKANSQKIKELYKTYRKQELFSQIDQIKLDNGIPLFRTEIIYTYIKNYIEGKKTLLDIGTGTGAFLKTCSNNTKMELYAYDLNDIHKDSVLKIPNVIKFYENSLENIEKKFDVISVIHVLEHIDKAIEFLETIYTLLNSDGVIIIQVPNIWENNNDILMIDHLSHFSPITIVELVSKVFDSVEIINTTIYNEITIIGTKAKSENTTQFHINEKDVNFEYINEISRYLGKIKEPIYIFGTAPISIFFAKILNNRNMLKGFLDEDFSKVNQSLWNIKVEHPERIKQVEKCFIPLHTTVIQKIEKKYDNLILITEQTIKKEIIK